MLIDPHTSLLHSGINTIKLIFPLCNCQDFDALFLAQDEFASSNSYHQDDNDLVPRSRRKYVHLKTHRAPTTNHASKSCHNFTSYYIKSWFIVLVLGSFSSSNWKSKLKNS